jgi:hypothetical protein
MDDLLNLYNPLQTSNSTQNVVTNDRQPANPEIKEESSEEGFDDF